PIASGMFCRSRVAIRVASFEARLVASALGGGCCEFGRLISEPSSRPATCEVRLAVDPTVVAERWRRVSESESELPRSDFGSQAGCALPSTGVPPGTYRNPEDASCFRT